MKIPIEVRSYYVESPLVKEESKPLIDRIIVKHQGRAGRQFSREPPYVIRYPSPC